MANNLVSLEDALTRYDRTTDRAAVDLAEKERQEVIHHFPIEQWSDLPLERYALGQGRKHDSFCWWMEFGTQHVGSMKGGQANKHLIYRKADGSWYFDAKSYKTEAEQWQAVRAAFVEAFKKAKAGEWDSIDDIPLLSRVSMLRGKALYTYFPNDLLPIVSPAHLKHFLQRVGGTLPEEMTLDGVRLNRMLLARLRKIERLNGWHTKELERFLYHWADPRDRQRVVKIAPGEDAGYWDECLANNYICVGWGDAGDLREFESKDAYRAEFREVYGAGYNNHEPTISKKSNEAWMLRELEAGDRVVANHGTAKVIAVGTVVEPGYEWIDRKKGDFNNIVHVKWDTSFAQAIPPQKKWAFITVADVPQSLAAQILSKQGPGPGPVVPLPVDPLFHEIASAMERKGQVILYGPPGTGKTYAARRFAVWWLLRKEGKELPELLSNLKAFSEAEQRLATSELVQRVWWVVANPENWSWDRLFKTKTEAFELGKIARNFPLVRKGDLVIGYQSTPDKKIVAVARVSREFHTSDKGVSQIVIEAVAKVENGVTFKELQDDPVLRESEPMQHNNRGTLFKLSEEQFEHLAELLVERNDDLRKHLQAGTGVGPLTQLTFHASYSYEDFIEGFRPADTGDGTLSLRLEDGVFKRICRAAQATPDKPYLVLIDEFNRANVAKVFGELITLLEKDKRGMIINLPQSKEAFTIPPNVYVLGTMNTADRSIKLLDTALRRRFAFLELMPNSSLLEGKVGNLALDEFLDELNRRIARKEGREKQIGHSFLMDGDNPITEQEEFARRFRQEILPLLQEYCYEDYRVLADYIGEKLVKQDAQMLDEEVLNDDDSLVAALEEEFVQKDTTA